MPGHNYDHAFYLSAGVFGLYPCNATAIQAGQLEILGTQFKINAYTRDKEFDPIVMYFYKCCGSNAPEGDDLYCVIFSA